MLRSKGKQSREPWSQSWRRKKKDYSGKRKAKFISFNDFNDF